MNVLVVFFLISLGVQIAPFPPPLPFYNWPQVKPLLIKTWSRINAGRQLLGVMESKQL